MRLTLLAPGLARFKLEPGSFSPPTFVEPPTILPFEIICCWNWSWAYLLIVFQSPPPGEIGIWTMVIKRCSAGVFSPSGEVLNKPWVELLEYVGKGGDSLPVAGLSNRKRDSPAFNTIRNPLHDIPYSTVPVLLSCLEEVGSKGTSWTNNTVSWNFPFISCPNHTGMT